MNTEVSEASEFSWKYTVASSLWQALGLAYIVAASHGIHMPSDIMICYVLLNYIIASYDMMLC